MLSKQLSHLLWHHVFGIAIHLRETDDRDIVVSIRVCTFIRGLLLILIITLMIRQRPSRIMFADIRHRGDAIEAFLKFVLAMILRESLGVVLLND